MFLNAGTGTNLRLGDQQCAATNCPYKSRDICLALALKLKIQAMSKDPKFKVQQLSAVAAICSAAAALISVFLSAYAVYMAKSSLDHAVRMEQIRIRPHIDIAGGRFYAFDVIKIINTGLGPAIIESIVISNGETKIDLADPKVNRSPNVWSAIEAIFKFQ